MGAITSRCLGGEERSKPGPRSCHYGAKRRSENTAVGDNPQSPIDWTKQRSSLGVAVRQASVSDVLGPTPRVLSLTTTAEPVTLPTAASGAFAPVGNPVERLCHDKACGLAVLDRARLAAELKPFSQPVAVLYVSYVSPTPGPSAYDTGNNSVGSLEGRTNPHGPNGTLAVRRNSHDGSVCLVFSTEQGSTSIGCVLTNAAAVSALQLRDEQDMLNFLARSFAKDPSLKVLFQDIVKRLLQGQLHTVNHFVPGDFGRDRYFLSMRISPFAYRYGEQPIGDGEVGLESSYKKIVVSQGSVGPPQYNDPRDGSGGGITPAMILELDVPYEGKELAARLQRDYMILSNIPSIVTMFDMAGRVLHQNRSSVAYMGYLVGLDPVHDSNLTASKAPTSEGALSPKAGAALATDPRNGVQQPKKEDVDGGAAAAASSSPNRLRQLFGHKADKVEEMLQAVSQGMEWRGLIRMPARVEWGAQSDDAAAAVASDDDSGSFGAETQADASTKPSATSKAPSAATGSSEDAAATAATVHHNSTAYGTKPYSSLSSGPGAGLAQRRATAVELLRALQSTVMSGNAARSCSLTKLQAQDSHRFGAPRQEAQVVPGADEGMRELSAPGTEGVLGALSLGAPPAGSLAATGMRRQAVPRSAQVPLLAMLPRAACDGFVPSDTSVDPTTKAVTSDPADPSAAAAAGSGSSALASAAGVGFVAPLGSDCQAGGECTGSGQDGLTGVLAGSPVDALERPSHAGQGSASTCGATSGATLAHVTPMEPRAAGDRGAVGRTAGQDVSHGGQSGRSVDGSTDGRSSEPAGDRQWACIGDRPQAFEASPGDEGKEGVYGASPPLAPGPGSVWSVPILAVQTSGSGCRSSPQLMVPVLSAPLCPTVAPVRKPSGSSTGVLAATAAAAAAARVYCGPVLPTAFAESGARTYGLPGNAATGELPQDTASGGLCGDDAAGGCDKDVDDVEVVAASSVELTLSPALTLMPPPPQPRTHSHHPAIESLTRTESALGPTAAGGSGCSSVSSGSGNPAEGSGAPDSDYPVAGEGQAAQAAARGSLPLNKPHGGLRDGSAQACTAAAPPIEVMAGLAAWSKDGKVCSESQSATSSSGTAGQAHLLCTTTSGTTARLTAGRLDGSGGDGGRTMGCGRAQRPAARGSNIPLGGARSGSQEDAMLATQASQGANQLADGSSLMSTDNFSIEFALQHLQPALHARSSSSPSRSNTASVQGGVATPRPLAYIDEEDADDDDRVEELSFLLPKVAIHTGSLMGPTSAPLQAASDPLQPHGQPRFVSISPVPKLPDPVCGDSVAGINTDSYALHTKDLVIAATSAADGTSAPLLCTASRGCPLPRAVACPSSAPIGQGPATYLLTSALDGSTNTTAATNKVCYLQPATDTTIATTAAALPPRAGVLLFPASAAIEGAHCGAFGAVSGQGRVSSGPVGTARGMSRHTNLVSSRHTKTYLQQTGLEQGRRLRSVLRALTSNGAGSSGSSSAAALLSYNPTCSEALVRQPQSAGGPVNAVSMVIPKLPKSMIAQHPAVVVSESAEVAAASVALRSVPSTRLVPAALSGAVQSRNDDDQWHEVHVKPCFDPMSSEPLVMVIQTDVTSKVRAEELLARVLEAEHRLLADIFPRHVVHYMTQRRKDEAELERNGLMLLRHIQDPAAVATLHDSVSVLFADIKGFTEMSKEVPPAVVMTFLNDLYTRFDSLTDVYGVYKVETIGDCYMVAGGLMAWDGDGYGRAVRGQTDPLHAMRVVAFARAMLGEAAKVQLPNTGKPVQVRVGIHSGPVMSGVVGTKMPRFCLFGDTINTASRMESTGRPGAIHVSCSTRQLLPPEEDEEVWAATGGVEVKGKGCLDTYLWSPQSAGADRQRRHKQQRAMLLGTLRTMPHPSALASPPPSLRGRGHGGAARSVATASTTRHSANVFDATSTIR